MPPQWRREKKKEDEGEDEEDEEEGELREEEEEEVVHCGASCSARSALAGRAFAVGAAPAPVPPVADVERLLSPRCGQTQNASLP